MTKLSEFPGARDFLEVPDESNPLGAFAVVVDGAGNAWAFDETPVPVTGSTFEELAPRPISPDEIAKRGGFRVKPEDVDELVRLPGALS